MNAQQFSFFERILRDISQTLRPLDKGPHRHQILIQSLRRFVLVLPPVLKCLGIDVFEILPFAFLHQRADVILHALNVTLHATGGDEFTRVKFKMICQRDVSRFTHFLRRDQTDRFLAVFVEYLLKLLLCRPFLGNMERNIFRFVFVGETNTRAIQPGKNQFAGAPTFGPINVSNHIFSF
ncbi:MAG: hypothetical protein ABSC01_13630 [Verrucomicrobiota bacterium]